MQLEKIKKYKLIRRQLNDIIVQIEKVKYSRNFRRDIQEFARYSLELKKYILQNVKEDEIIETAKQLSDININRFHRRYWYHYLIFPWYLTLVFNDLLARDDIIPYLDSLKIKYGKIYQMLTNIINK